MKILITGAGGQIGHDLIGALLAAGHDVTSTDLAPRPLAGIVLEITETDPFELTWTLPELRVYRRL